MSAEAHPIVIAYAGLLGLVLGSFLNVCIVRWGAEPKQSVVRPRSRCPRCGHEIRWYENIPVLSWIALRAKCARCGLPISPLYPAIELATGLLWAGAVVLLGPTLAALQLAVAATLLLGIAVSDARAFIIPHEFSLGGTAIALAFALAIGGGDALLLAAQGALFGAGIVLLVGEVTELILDQEAMGGGDCALMGMVGAFFGWEAVLPVVALGACVSLVLYFVAALMPRRAAPSVTASDEGEPAGLRWGKVLKLLVGGSVLVGGLGFALRAGVMPSALGALFHGLLGAGAAYYLGFAIPDTMAPAVWVRVRGVLGAAIGVAVGGRSVPAVAAAVVIGGLALAFARRSDTPPSPETTEELSAGGYLPFGVGLAIAAALLAYSGGYESVRRTFAELAPGLGLS